MCLSFSLVQITIYSKQYIQKSIFCTSPSLFDIFLITAGVNATGRLSFKTYGFNVFDTAAINEDRVRFEKVAVNF